MLTSGGGVFLTGDGAGGRGAALGGGETAVR